MKNIFKIWLASRFLGGGGRKRGCGCLGTIILIIVVLLILGMFDIIDFGELGL